MSAIKIYNVYVSYILYTIKCFTFKIYIWLNYILYIRTKIILIIYGVITSPTRMNIVSTIVFIVEQLINICGLWFICIAICIRSKNYVY